MRTNEPIDTLLNDARLALTNARSLPTVRDALAARGYEEAQLQEGDQLLARAVQLHDRQQNEYVEQHAATDALAAARTDADRIYIEQLELARIAFKNNAALTESLMLNGARKQSLSGWLRQAQRFYTNALAQADVQAGFTRFKVTPADLQNGQRAVQAVADADARRAKERGEAQQATRQRDEALDDLHDWLSDFIGVARIALSDQPQQLEQLGIVVPTAQRATPTGSTTPPPTPDQG